MTEPLRTARSSARFSRAGILLPDSSPTRTIIIAAIAVAVVLGAGLALHGSDFDLAITRAANRLHVGAIAAVTNTVYRCFEPVVAVTLVVVAAAVIWVLRRNIRPAAAFAVVIAGTWVPADVIKVIVGRHRPSLTLLPHPFVTQPDPSYPSGHTVFVVVAAFAAVWLLQDTRAARGAKIIAPIAVLVVLCSLLIDGVHFPSDIVASILWAVGVAPLVRLVWVAWIAPHIPGLR